MSRQLDVSTSVSLVMKLRNHDDGSAWTEFVDVYSPLIYGFCRSRNLQSADSADITQDVLLRVAKAIRTFEYDQSKGLFRDWLARIVLNEIRRQKTKNRPSAVDPRDLDMDNKQLESEWNDHFQQHILAIALERSKPHFNEETWILFEKSWIQKLSIEQVVQELAVGAERVYVARSRFLKRLKYEIGILADDYMG